MLLSVIYRPGGIDRQSIQILINAIAGMTLQGAIGGAAMSPLFEYLRRFEPRSKAGITR